MSTPIIATLMKRFPNSSEEDVQDALLAADGHGGKAASILMQACAAVESVNMSTSIIATLMKRFPNSSEEDVQDVLLPAGGHRGKAASILMGKPIEAAYAHGEQSVKQPSAKSVKLYGQQ